MSCQLAKRHYGAASCLRIQGPKDLGLLWPQRWQQQSLCLPIHTVSHPRTLKSPEFNWNFGQHCGSSLHCLKISFTRISSKDSNDNEAKYSL
jgi:hypothetical protein